ncbi:MAG: phosphodiester glycosidase family protein [Armatimonadota bacterium]|nr:phosphodiester glycosidase family protein [bacterium]
MRFSKLVPLFIIIALSSPVSALQVTKELAPGVTLVQDINTDTKPLIVNILKIDPANPSVHIKAAIGQDVVFTDTATKGRETISSITGRKSALAGVNADYFPFTGDPLGACIVDGELISEPSMNRVMFGLLKNQRVIFDNPILNAKLIFNSGINRQIDGINRIRETNQVIVYTEAFGATTQNKYKATDVIAVSDNLPVQIGKPMRFMIKEVLSDAINTPIPKGGVIISAGGAAGDFIKANAKVGDEISMRFDFYSPNGCDWTLAEQAVGGGPWLLKDGQISIDYKDEEFKRDFSTTTHPRTALGLTALNELLLVTVDGRQPMSKGMSLTDLANLMKQLGARNAINLDGGGSTTMSIKGAVINSPSEGDERPVADALLVHADQKPVAELPELSISGFGEQTVAGEPAQLFLTWGDDAQMLTEDQLAHVVWGTTNGIGFINQKGWFMPMRAKTGTVTAIYGSQKVCAKVTVVTGVTAKLNIDVRPNGVDPLLARVTVTVTDTSGNLLPDREVKLVITGGKADAETGTTNAAGEFVTGLTWEENAGQRSIKASVGNATAEMAVPVTVQ